ncbi:D-alanyl-D-alanine carboxypeptidase family protein [Gordonia sp. MP11Mi]|uniref:D-alanyl-D-alanine carboxypeptidase-like core domain-containing protein n=1 Tax=Gordonia sp. MP11Mi TaxID=3022769 RepID=A0AA97CW03_9ACTN
MLHPSSTSGDVDGYIPDDNPISPFADVPAMSRLDPDLRAATEAAARAARSDGINIGVTSGWRSVELQKTLQEQTTREKGHEYAATHVLPADRSKHVLGLAVDIGPTDAADWMSRSSAQFGLCQVYANELWHYELTAEDGNCPPMRADSTA